MDLTLENLGSLNSAIVNAPYELSSYVYGMKLERLLLSNCILKTPCSFKGFHRLTDLVLKLIYYGTDTLDLGPFMSGTLKMVGLMSLEEFSQNTQDKVMQLTNLLHGWPDLTALVLGKYFLKCLAFGFWYERGEVHTYLTNLVLNSYDFEVKTRTFPFYAFLETLPI